MGRHVHVRIPIYQCPFMHIHEFYSKRDQRVYVLPWTPTYGRAKAERPARTYIPQLCEDTGCRPEDLPEAMNDREKWREGQGYPCLWHDRTMIMMIYLSIYVSWSILGIISFCEYVGYILKSQSKRRWKNENNCFSCLCVFYEP